MLYESISAGARSESAVWGRALRAAPDWEPVFSPLAPARFALGLETVYEAYLVHYGKGRLFETLDRDEAVLLGDYLYAHGLVRIASLHDAAAVADLAALISVCAQLRADDAQGDGAAWAATAALLGRDGLAPARDALRLRGDADPLLTLARATAGADAVDQALAAHGRRVG